MVTRRRREETPLAQTTVTSGSACQTSLRLPKFCWFFKKKHSGRNSKELFQFFRNLPQVAPGRFQVNDGRWRGCGRRGSVSVWALLLCAGFLCRDWNAQPACEMLRMEVTHCSVLGFPSNLFAVSPGYSNTRELQGFSADKRWAGRPAMTGETCLNPNGRDAVMNACGYKRAGK